MWSRSQEEPAVDIWWSLHLRREPASVPLARRILLGTMASAGVDPEVSHQVGVALTEACANAVEHAVCGGVAAPDGGFQVTATIEGGCLRVEITDTGPGFSAEPGNASPVPGHLPEVGDTRTWIRPCAARGPRPRSRVRLRAPLTARCTTPARTALGTPSGLSAEAGTVLPDLYAEHGRGLFLIRALMDHVQFRNNPRSGAVVSFDKMLTYRDRPLLHAS
ncbi:ATP-binding protein [Streptacidiphilus sp. EB129]|uniref:ATP-binding protein n=1 Tax=Streptacidiphilus sp. EB129 TaxID=3156262 RepID=UPI003519C2FA